jgi:hypothetical protein
LENLLDVIFLIKDIILRLNWILTIILTAIRITMILLFIRLLFFIFLFFFFFAISLQFLFF